MRAAQQQLGRLGRREVDLLFPSPQGGIWRKDNFMARVFRPAVRRAALKGLTFHDLRHTYASLMVAAGVSAQVIADQLGHSDARLVLQRYGHLYPGASERAALALDAYLLILPRGRRGAKPSSLTSPTTKRLEMTSGACGI
jgi:integrase